MDTNTLASPDTVEAFIVRWQSAGGSERANYQLFITELCELLGLPKPEPAKAEAQDNAYVFERRVTFRHGDGSSSNGYIALSGLISIALRSKSAKRPARLFRATGRIRRASFLPIQRRRTSVTTRSKTGWTSC